MFSPEALINGRYRIQQALTETSVGGDWLALDQESNSRVVLSVATGLAPAAFTTRAEQLEQRFHPNLPQVLDHFTRPDGAVVLVSEYLDGQTLAERVQRDGPLTPAAALALADPLLSALDYLHRRTPPVLHGAVDPTHVRLTVGGEPTLVGYALALDPAPPPAILRPAPETPVYDAQTEQYLLAATLHYALSGKAPGESPAPLRRVAPRVPAEVAAALDQALQPAPAARFSGVGELRRALSTSEGTVSSRPPATPSEPAPEATPVDRQPTARPTLATATSPRPTPTRPLAAPRKQSNPPLWLIAAFVVAMTMIVVGGGWLWQAIANRAVAVSPTAEIATEVEITATLAAVAAQASETPVAASETAAPTATLSATETASATATVTATLPPSETPAPTTPPETPTPAATTEPAAGTILTASRDGMPLVYVPAGPFQLGSDVDADSNAQQNEQPQVTLNLPGFWIDQHEVTNRQYFMCVMDLFCTRPQSNDSATVPNYFLESDYINHPVLNVRWQQAYAYCDWAGRVLPNEAQWEKAARGPDGQLYPWGNITPNDGLANYGALNTDVVAVGQFPAGASPYGVVDMSGNVAEWVSNYFVTGYFGIEDFLSSSPDPATLFGGGLHTIRNGAWNANPLTLRVATRQFAPNNDYASNTVGFRCASEQPPD